MRPIFLSLSPELASCSATKHVDLTGRIQRLAQLYLCSSTRMLDVLVLLVEDGPPRPPPLGLGHGPPLLLFLFIEALLEDPFELLARSKLGHVDTAVGQFFLHVRDGQPA